MHLNQEQYEAVFSTSGPVVVCAGAGSGKTRVITYRTLHLITLGNKPQSILCVTFTNKAAKEMKERIYTLLEEQETYPTVTTFHGFALELLRTYGHAINLPSFTVLGEDQQTLLIKNILSQLDIKDKSCTPKKIISMISFIKNNYFEKNQYKGEIAEQIFSTIYQMYESEKTKNATLDFDDLLLYSLKILQNKDVITAIRKKIRHIMIDEYQDTNSVQHMLVKKIALLHTNELAVESLFVVGDDDQSIYSFRGANVANILNFKSEFEATKTIHLTKNYRSTNAILTLANSLIAKNKVRNKKSLWTDNENSSPTYLVEYETGYHEAMETTRIIKKIQKTNNHKGSFAVLYRSHYQSRLIEESLIAQNIPYKIYGGLNFYQREEIKDILSYLYLVANPRDKTSFLRCANTPTRGLGDVTQQDFIEYWSHEEGEFLDVIEKYLNEKKLTPRARQGFVALQEIIAGCQQISSPDKAIAYIIEKSHYHHYIEKHADNDLEIETRKENLQELINAAKTFATEHTNSIADFTAYVTILYDQDKNQDDESSENTPDPVILMSIHAAKGLEFDTVFLIGLEEGIFPSSRQSYSQESIEEERRLLYVGLTRARQKLIVSHVRTRLLWGKHQIQYPSLFIADFTPGTITKLSYKELSYNRMEAILSV
jgi:DNA helicase-2/ATP-dependent DNA helicase PcrA